MGFFDILQLLFLHAQLEKANHKIRQSERNAYFDWYLESSKRGNDRVISLQETNKKLLETISELKRPQTLTPSSALLLLCPHLSELPGPGASSSQPPAAPLPSEKESKKSGVIIAPFKETPITGRGKPSLGITYTAWTRREFRALAKDFPDPVRIHWDKKFELTIRTYEPRFSDLYQLI